MITCYIVDDEAHALQVLQRYIEKTPGLQLIGNQENPLEALQLIRAGLKVDITFVDIDMPQLSGIDLAALLRPYTKVVFTTAYRDFALEGFELNAVDYLLKPITYERFLQAFGKIQAQAPAPSAGAGQEDDEYFFIKSEVKGRVCRIDLKAIRYVEAVQNYVRIHTVDRKHLTYLTMKEIEEHLPHERFMRVHKSFIVHTAYVMAVEGNQILFDNQESIPLGASYREEFLAHVNAKLWKSKRLP